MTMAEALEICDYLINRKTKYIQEIQEEVKSRTHDIEELKCGSLQYNREMKDFYKSEVAKTKEQITKLETEKTGLKEDVARLQDGLFGAAATNAELEKKLAESESKQLELAKKLIKALEENQCLKTMME